MFFDFQYLGDDDDDDDDYDDDDDDEHDNDENLPVSDMWMSGIIVGTM